MPSPSCAKSPQCAGDERRHAEERERGQAAEHQGEEELHGDTTRVGFGVTPPIASHLVGQALERRRERHAIAL
jgi:hypothetical protein